MHHKRKFLLKRLPAEIHLQTEVEIKSTFTNKTFLHQKTNSLGIFALYTENIFTGTETEISLDDYTKCIQEHKDKKVLIKKQILYRDWIFNIISNQKEDTFYHMQLIIAEIRSNEILDTLELPVFIVNNLIKEITSIHEFADISLAN